MDPEGTPQGKLPPWEIAKCIAFEQVIIAMEQRMGKSCWEILGTSRAMFASQHLKLVGGGHPSDKAVKDWWRKAKEDPTWFPGKAPENQGGRPPQISDAQKQAIAEKAMELKKQIIAPTPEAVKILMPRKTINKVTKRPICDKTFNRVYQTLCYDEREDDTWHYLPSVQQDCLTAEDKPKRVKTAEHVIDHVSEHAAFNYVAIDPCFSLLPKEQEKAEQLKIAAMGHMKWMSKGSRRKGINLRASRTAKTQKDNCTIVPWTPVFARGCLRLVVLTQPGAKLNNSSLLAAFVRDTLPKELESMKKEFRWSNIPRVVLHDRATPHLIIIISSLSHHIASHHIALHYIAWQCNAMRCNVTQCNVTQASYFVNSKQNCLNTVFDSGLKAGRFTSWVESGEGECSWLARHLGDLYPHESVISHVRRLLSSKFRRETLHETPGQFAARMKKVERYLNYEMKDGESLEKLGHALHKRSEELKKRKGERLPK